MRTKRNSREKSYVVRRAATAHSQARHVRLARYAIRNGAFNAQFAMHHLRSTGNARDSGDRVSGISRVRPSSIGTALESNVTVAGCKPSRVAVSLIVPGMRVERMATRLMPHSVCR